MHALDTVKWRAIEIVLVRRAAAKQLAYVSQTPGWVLRIEIVYGSFYTMLEDG